MKAIAAVARVAIVGLLAAFNLGHALAQAPPPQEPQLRIDPGMHTAIVNRVGVDASCSLLVTAADDKTIRLWRLPSGKPISTLRPPIGSGDYGKVYAVAVPPDGKWVAAGGYDARWAVSSQMYIYIFESATGRSVAQLGPHGSTILHLALSSDARYLAATLGGGEGVRVWQRLGPDFSNWRLVATDKDYGGKQSYGAAFSRSGTLYTVADDAKLRAYAPPYAAKPKFVTTRGGNEPFSVSVHPNDDRVAIGYVDTTAIEVYDATTLALRFTADNQGVANGSLNTVSWSKDGSRLFAGGQFWRNGFHPIRVWDRAGQAPGRELKGPNNSLMHIIPCGDGLAIASADPAFGLIGVDGTRRLWRENVQPDQRARKSDYVRNLTVSADGTRVRFPLEEISKDPVLFDLGSERISDSPQIPSDLSPADTSSLPITGWEDTRDLKVAGKPYKLREHELSRALAIAPDRMAFALGADFALRALDKDGKLLWDKQIPGTAWGVNIPRNGRIVIAAYGDGTIRWHRLSDGQELLALFVHAKDRRWVAWTPKGYYTASTGGEEMIGWHVNRGWNEAADYFPAAQFRDQFNRPDIVQRVLVTLDEDNAIDEANAASKRERAIENVRDRLPPVVAILSPSEGGGFSSSDLTLEYSVRSPSGLPVTVVRALIDGRPAEGAQTKGFVPVGTGDTKGTLQLTGVPSRNVNISVIAETGDLASVPATVALQWKGTQTAMREEDLRKGKLYALVVGVGSYKDSRIKGLTWAAQDARDMKATLETQKGKLYRDVDVRLLTEKDATRGAIIDGLEWMKRNVLKGDVGVLFLSGHGATDDRAGYYFVPHDAELDADAGLFLPKRSTAVPNSEILEALKSVRGHTLFFFDTCHAGSATGIRLKGNIDLRKTIAELASAQVGAFVLASSDGGQLSQERDEWRNGAFTKAMKEGLAGAADYTRDGIVTLDELSLYVKERVKELTNGLQLPVDLRPQETQNIPLAAVR